MEPQHARSETDVDWALEPARAGRHAGSGPGDQASDDEATEAADPERLGRFVVLRRLGTGGMGTVLEAYDETLDRKVAVKQLHRDASGEAGQHHRQRLLREAQALARLSHPNVVQIYDAGEERGRLYIAMELVEGQTLWEWQKTPRPWPEVLRAYMGAGAGLAAAHAQGVVHRDFKPTNCIIDAQGRVKVLDFGLARGVDDIVDDLGLGDATESLDAEAQAAAAADTRVMSEASLAEPALAGLGASPRPLRASESDVAVSSGGVLSLQLTRTGAMLGTPAYMAPEQAAGAPTDARSDQFSFCVALCEAIYGERPFAGNTGLAVLAGRLPRFPTRVRPGLPAVPPWLRKVLSRGMAGDKEQRFATMEQLLAALQHGQRRRRWLGAAALGVLGVLGVGAAAAAALERGPCDGLRDADMPGWSATERSAVRAALEPTRHVHVWEATHVGLDGYARGWIDARAQACEATHVQHVASEEVLELRVACLDRRALQLRATVELLAQADDRVAARAAQVVRSLPPVEPCLDVEQLRQGPAPLPEALAVPAAEIRALVASAWAFDAAGRAAEGLEAAERAVAAAEPLGPEGEPLRAEAALGRGRLYRAARRLDDARRDLELALQTAEHDRDETLGLEALLELMLVAHDAADRSAFGAWLVVARGKLRRHEQEPRTRARLLHLEGLSALREGQPARAVEALGAAADQWRELGPAASLELARSLVQLGVARGRLGQDDGAEDAFASAQALAERDGLLPLLAEAQHERGRMHLDRGRPEQAEQWLARALELRVAIDGPAAPTTIPTRVPLAILLQQRGALAEAIAMAQAAKDALGPAVPPHSHAQVMSLLARFHRQQGDWLAALDDYQRVEEALAASPSPDPVERAMLDSNVADCLRIMGRLDAARVRYERALEGLRVHAAASDQRHVYPLHGLGSLLAEQRDLQGAAAILRRALAIQEATPKDLDMGAILRWDLGRVVLEDATAGAPERAEALGLVRAAQDQYRAFGDTATVAEIAAFLERCGVRCGGTQAP